MKQQRFGLKKLIEMFFIDANIFLEVELDDERSDECRELFLKIYKDHAKAVTSDFVVYTCLIQIESKTHSVDKMQNFILFLDNMTEIEINSPTYKTIYSTFEIMKKYKLDFDDALVVSIMLASGIKELVSFDRHFDNVKEIKRMEPQQILE